MTQICQIKNTRFGDLDFPSSEVFTFPDGLVGFSDEHEFALIRNGGASNFLWLQSIHNPALAFPITDPLNFVEDYAPVEIEEDEKIYTTVSLSPGNPHDMSLNLAGPISLNLSSRTAKQIVLECEAYTTKYRVFAGARSEQAEAAA